MPPLVQLSALVQEALTMLRAVFPARIAIRLRLAQDTGEVLANATQLYQVLLNLCTNVEQAMRETGGELEIALEAVQVEADFAATHTALRPGAYVRLTVRDTGKGMPPEVMQHIFEPFFSTKSPEEGTGLGLTTVNNIVTSHNGAI